MGLHNFMRTSPEGLELIKLYEGCKLKAYKCSAGKLTIGVGHVIKPDEKINKVITDAEAMALLSRDVREAEEVLENGVTVELKQHQYDALVSFIFNVGGSAFMSSTLRKKLNAGAGTAYMEFKHWVYAGHKVIPGLVKRRASERVFFQTGDKPRAMLTYMKGE